MLVKKVKYVFIKDKYENKSGHLLCRREREEKIHSTRLCNLCILKEVRYDMELKRNIPWCRKCYFNIDYYSWGTRTMDTVQVSMEGSCGLILYSRSFEYVFIPRYLFYLKKC